MVVFSRRRGRIYGNLLVYCTGLARHGWLDVSGKTLRQHRRPGGEMNLERSLISRCFKIGIGVAVAVAHAVSGGKLRPSLRACIGQMDVGGGGVQTPVWYVQ